MIDEANDKNFQMMTCVEMKILIQKYCWFWWNRFPSLINDTIRGERAGLWWGEEGDVMERTWRPAPSRTSLHRCFADWPLWRSVMYDTATLRHYDTCHIPYWGEGEAGGSVIYYIGSSLSAHILYDVPSSVSQSTPSDDCYELSFCKYFLLKE